MSEPIAIVGREDWLFLDRDSNKIMSQITGQFQLADDFEKKWEDLGEFRREQFAKRGIDYGLLIAPNKECVYSEYLPDGIIFSSNRPVERVIGCIGHNINTTYPIQTLKHFRKYQETFPKGDTHWNQYGAFCAYRVLMTNLGIKPLSDTDIAFSSISVAGDLSSKIGQSTETVSAKILDDKVDLVFNNRVKNIGGLSIWEHQDKTLPKLVLFRDSFATNFLRMIVQHFSRTVVVWQPNIDYGIVDREQPQYVISEQAERFLTKPPDDLNGLSNEQNAARKK